jgi:hypothetical protein
MKYSNTSRALSLLFHFVLFAAFGCLGAYFGFFVVPQYFDLTTRDSFNANVAGQPFNLYLSLAAVGMAIFTASLYGFIQAVKATNNPSDETSLEKSFLAFIADGYIAAVFFIAHGVLYFDLAANSNLALKIVMAILIGIIILIATNIPMYKLYDGKDTSPLLSGLSMAGAESFGWIAIFTLLSLIGSYKYINGGAGYGNGTREINLQLLVVLAVSLIICGLSLAGAFLMKKKGDTDAKALKLGTFLNAGSFFALGAGLIAEGVFEFVWKDKPVHLEAGSGTLYAFTGYGYGIMAVILGACFFAAAIALIVMTAKGEKKAAPKA